MTAIKGNSTFAKQTKQKKKLKIMGTSSIHIGEQRKAFAPTYRDVVIRAKNGNYITVSLGFDAKGNDITCVIHKDDILPKQTNK